MTVAPLNPEQLAILAALANGIIPADQTDAGAASVNAAPRLAKMIEAGVNTDLYLKGLESARSMAQEKFPSATPQLNPREIHELLGCIQKGMPNFFKQLRMDVSALYLSDPAVWRRIGFPGPSIASGGYPDFDQPQEHKIFLEETKVNTTE